MTMYQIKFKCKLDKKSTNKRRINQSRKTRQRRDFEIINEGVSITN